MTRQAWILAFAVGLAVLLTGSGFAQQDPNDPGYADTVYFVGGRPCSYRGDTLYFPPGGGDVRIHIRIWNDEGLLGMDTPLNDSTYGPPSYAFLDASKNNGSPNPLCFQGSRVENFQMKACVLDSNPPQVVYGAGAIYDSDSLLPGNGLFATMVYSVSDTGRICLDTLFYPPAHYLILVRVEGTNRIGFFPQFVSKCFYLQLCPPYVIADFAGRPSSGSPPLEVHFEDLSVGCPTSWHWDFGDGYTDTVQNPTHVYTDTGYYEVRFTISNAESADTLSRADYIRVLWFIRGDANGDTEITLLDIVHLTNYLFRSGPPPVPALEAGDANCDDDVGLADVVYLINYLFKSGPPPCEPE